MRGRNQSNLMRMPICPELILEIPAHLFFYFVRIKVDTTIVHNIMISFHEGAKYGTLSIEIFS